MGLNCVAFSLAGQVAWAPGVTSAAEWEAWAHAPWMIAPGAEAPVAAMPAMLRRRAGALGKMALQVAFECLGERSDVPMVFCSRHGEVSRAIELLSEMVRGEPVSPTGFGLSVHNASAGLLSIARGERANQIALAGGAATVEQGVIEACALLADGAPMVLLVAYDAPLPPVLKQFEDCVEQPFAFAWAMVPAGAGGDGETVRLAWQGVAATADAEADVESDPMPGGLQVLRFHLSGRARMQRLAGARRWTWSRDD
jgi:hypothetical protein